MIVVLAMVLQQAVGQSLSNVTVRNGDKAATVIMAADKIVNGARVAMGDLTFAYDAPLACWRSDFESPRLKSRWCFTVEGNTLKGTATLLPGNQVVRRINATRVP